MSVSLSPLLFFPDIQLNLKESRNSSVKLLPYSQDQANGKITRNGKLDLTGSRQEIGASVVADESSVRVEVTHRLAKEVKLNYTEIIWDRTETTGDFSNSKGTFAFHSIQSFSLTMGSNADKLTVEDTVGGNAAKPLRLDIETGDGADEVTIAKTDKHSDLSIKLGAGNDKVTITNNGSASDVKGLVRIEGGTAPGETDTVKIDHGQNDPQAVAKLDVRKQIKVNNTVRGIELKNVKATLIAPPRARVAVPALGPDVALTLEVSGPTSTLVLGGDDGTMNDLLGRLTVVGGGDRDEVIFRDRGHDVGTAYSLLGQSLTADRLPGFAVELQDVESLVLRAGAGPDSVELAPDGKLELELSMGRGDDLVTVTGGTVFDPDWAGLEELAIDGGQLVLVDDRRLHRYRQPGGSLVGKGRLTVTESGLWTGGEMGLDESGTGETRVAAGATFDIVPSDESVSLAGRTLFNFGTLTQHGGTVDGDGVIENRGDLSASGKLVGRLINRDQLAVGGFGSAGRYAVLGEFEQTAGVMHLDLGAPGQSDRLLVDGGLTLGGRLAIYPGGLADGWTLIRHVSPDPTYGVFVGLPEETPVDILGEEFVVSYKGWDGNDVVLRSADGGEGRDDDDGDAVFVGGPPDCDPDTRPDFCAECRDGVWEANC